MLTLILALCVSASNRHQRRKKNYVETATGIRRNARNTVSWDNAAKYFRDLVMKEFLQVSKYIFLFFIQLVNI